MCSARTAGTTSAPAACRGPHDVDNSAPGEEMTNQHGGFFLENHSI